MREIVSIFAKGVEIEAENLPLVSIGVPVHNGEKGLSHTLDSLLGQDYGNLEIIISDNASTDSTPEICQRYVREDSRVKYFRFQENFGAIRNFNRVFELSSGKYFMWAAHDDRRASSFVSACVVRMEQSPDAVLCQAHTAIFIEGRDGLLYVANMDSYEKVSGLLSRYRETLKRFPATAIYGLYRCSAMRKTQMYQNVIATDLAFIQELSIYGEFIQVPSELFTYVGREKWNDVHQDYAYFFGKNKKPWLYMPFIALFREHWRRVAYADIPFAAKLRLWGVLIGHQASQFALKILLKTAGLLCFGAWRGKLACAIYWRWMRNPNVKVRNEELFFERVIKPQVGWWK